MILYTDRRLNKPYKFNSYEGVHNNIKHFIDILVRKKLKSNKIIFILPSKREQKIPNTNNTNSALPGIEPGITPLKNKI